MNKTALYLIILVIFLSACQIDQSETVEISPTATMELIPTETLIPQPSLTPTPFSATEGEIIVTVQQGRTYNLFLMDLAGNNQQQLTFSVAPASSGSADWSPDGTMLAYVTDDSGDYEIMVLDMETMEAKNLTNSPANEFSPTWSPDGSEIAYVVRDGNWMQIFVMDSDGENQRQLTDFSVFNGNPEWNSNGEWILFVHGSGVDFDLYRVNPETGSVVVVFDDEYDLGFPRMSPDGERILFASRYRAGTSEIYSIDLNGNDLQRLTNTGEHERSARWSPDGSNIIYAVSGDVIIMDADGSNSQVLFEGSYYSNPVWRPAQ